MSHVNPETAGLDELARSLVKGKRYPGLWVEHVAKTFNPKAPKNQTWMAVLHSEQPPGQVLNFTGHGASPCGAVILALCFERVSRQGWG